VRIGWRERQRYREINIESETGREIKIDEERQRERNEL